MPSPFKQKSKDIVDAIKQAPMYGTMEGATESMQDRVQQAHGNTLAPLGTQRRREQYEERDWKYDETTDRHLGDKVVRKGKELYEKVDTPQERKAIGKKILNKAVEPYKPIWNLGKKIAGKLKTTLS